MTPSEGSRYQWTSPQIEAIHCHGGHGNTVEGDVQKPSASNTAVLLLQIDSLDEFGVPWGVPLLTYRCFIYFALVSQTRK